MADNTVVAAQTAADSSFEFRVKQGACVSVSAYGLGVGEAVDIELKTGESWIDCYDADGTQTQITPARNPVPIDVPGHYRLNKPLTAGAVSLHLDA